MVVILQKMIMTGAMCVVAQGSSVQLLIAIMVMLMYMLLGKWDKNVCCLCRLFVSVVWYFSERCFVVVFSFLQS